MKMFLEFDYKSYTIFIDPETVAAMYSGTNEQDDEITNVVLAGGTQLHISGNVATNIGRVKAALNG